ncbi:hypothetical protein BD310DRAFT_226196 [Dichomitus squalens]|uniref:F-box domain-containing protein n=1 Tax=Dichomitus squalens TaxID=114155 RepID=A0A4Q9PHS7_9APHY|nr:hypothetical protein BD310DRAFT_226196 [Dichomitus squalens]
MDEAEQDLRHVHPSSVAALNPRMSQSAQIVLLHVDILTVLFNTFNTDDCVDLKACVNCARVCRAWNEPACRVAWRCARLFYLYYVIDPDPTKRPKRNSDKKPQWHRSILEGELYKNEKVWAGFLRYGGMIQRLYAKPRHTFDVAEATIVHTLLERNGRKTFVPSLRHISWLESVDWRGALLLIIPPTLESIALRIGLVARNDVQHIIESLPHTAREIHSIEWDYDDPPWNTEEWPHCPFEAGDVSGHSSLRRLTLKHAISIAELRGIFSQPKLKLEYLNTTVVGPDGRQINCPTTLKTLKLASSLPQTEPSLPPTRIRIPISAHFPFFEAIEPYEACARSPCLLSGTTSHNPYLRLRSTPSL